jgi:hypothetical protein
MLLAAQVYHTNSHNLTQQPNNSGYTSGDSARVIPVCLEAVSPDSHVEISGHGFFCLLKETLNG